MGDDRADPGPGDPSMIPIDALPDPIAGYELDGDRPVVAEISDAFEAAFGGVSPGAPVRRWLRTGTGADEATIDEICSALAGGGGIDAEVDAGTAGTAGAGRYRIRTLDRSVGGAVEGCVLVTESPARPEPLGADRIASAVSHDLRNPLDVAKAHLRAARETGSSEHLDQVGRSHDRMERIIRMLYHLRWAQRKLAAAFFATDAVGTGTTDP